MGKQLSIEELKNLPIYASDERFVKTTEDGKEKDRYMILADQEKNLNLIASSNFGEDIIAAQTTAQMKREMLYESRGRQILDAYQLSQGEDPQFDADLDVPAATISPRGLPEEVEVISDRIRFATSQIVAYFVVRWNESALRKFDVLEVARQRAMASIMYKEDVRIYNVIKFASNLTGQQAVKSLEGSTAADNNPKVIPGSSSRLNPVDLADSIGELRGKLLPASVVWVNPKRLTDLLLFNVLYAGGTPQGGGLGIFAPSVQEDVWKKGQLGEVFGVNTMESIVVPFKEVFTLAPKEYIGKLAIRKDIQVKTLSMPNFLGDVYAAVEDIGIGVRYAKGIVRIDLP